MKFHFYILAVLIFSVSVFAQKGEDEQTKKIRQDSRPPERSSSVGRSVDFGKDKTQTRTFLANPYKLNARRDQLVITVQQVLQDKQIIVDESASRLKDGLIVTQPFVFSKGAVITPTEINRYASVPNSDTIFTRGRYTLTIEIQSIDGVQNNISVLAKVEGKSGNGLISEWTTLPSTGLAEDEFLAKLIEAMTGSEPGGILDTRPGN